MVGVMESTICAVFAMGGNSEGLKVYLDKLGGTWKVQSYPWEEPCGAVVLHVLCSTVSR